LKDDLISSIVDSIQESLSERGGRPVLAQIFSFEDVLAQKKITDPAASDDLSTVEMYEAIDAAGYRPATFPELLAFARDHWVPEVVPEEMTEKQRREHTCAPGVIALVPFIDAVGQSQVPSLMTVMRKRTLSSMEDIKDQVWTSKTDDSFLVVAK